MKLVAFGLVLLGCLQSLAAPDLQVIALYEMRMMLTDSHGVLKDRRQQYENRQHHRLFSFSEESLNIHEAIELSGGR